MKALLKKSKCIVSVYEHVMLLAEKTEWREKKVSWGKENRDKIFYVIRRKPGNDGLFAYVNTFLGLIRYGIERGWIPVIDMEFCENTYLDAGLIGKVNAWEYYFEQPCGYSMNDIRKSHNIVLSGMETLGRIEYPSYRMAVDKNCKEKWKQIAGEYLHVKKDVLAKLEHRYTSMFGTADVLGVLCRGTDYIALRPKAHPVQPDVDVLIQKVRDVFNDGNYKFVFLATEDEQAYQSFKKAFGVVLKTTEAKRYNLTETKKLATTKEFASINKYQNGMDYLLNILMLTKCKGFISGCSGGGYGAILLKNQNWDYEYLFALGMYN